MYSVLMVAEKPMIAQSISNFLSKSRMDMKPIRKSKIYQFTTNFPLLHNEPVRVHFTSVFGHMTEINFASRDGNDPLNLFDIPIKTLSTDKGNLENTLTSVAEQCDFLVLWLDCDKEGEHICYEVMDCCMPHLRKSNLTKLVYRAKFSSISEAEIWNAMENLMDPNENIARSVDARRQLDLRIGCAYSRFLTNYFRANFPPSEKTGNVVTMGPCQTPTLGLVYDRYKKVENFTPEPYNAFACVLEMNNCNLDFSWNRRRIFDKRVAEIVHKVLAQNQHAVVVEVKITKKSVYPPVPLNTVAMISSVSKIYGISSFETMKIAESLYLSGYISYPRTESTKYPSSLNQKEVAALIGNYGPLRSQYHYVMDNHLYNSTNGVDKGDHPPIIPITVPSSQQLSPSQNTVFQFIAGHYLKTICSPYIYNRTSIVCSIGAELFSHVCDVTVDGGWFAIAGKDKQNIVERNCVNLSVANLNKGALLKVMSLRLVDCKTSKPDYLSESDLIKSMDKHEIGTDASMATHIKNVIERNYVMFVGNKKLVVSEFGKILVEAMGSIDDDLVSCKMRSTMEKQLNFIAMGRAPYLNVLNHFIANYRKKYIYFSTKFEAYENKFRSILGSTVSDTAKPFSRCGKCVGFMVLLEKKGVLFCKNCSQQYSINTNGRLKNYNGTTCPIDNFELVMWVDNLNKNIIKLICPNCYVNPTNERVKFGMDCSQCFVKNCPLSTENRKIAKCQLCEYGVIIPSVNDKFLICNRCDFSLRPKSSLSSFSIGEYCRICNESRRIRLHVINLSLSIKNSVCFTCEPEDVKQVFMIQMVTREMPSTSRDRGRGFGRGRFSSRGRGRGGDSRGRANRDFKRFRGRGSRGSSTMPPTFRGRF